jgi:lipoate-protein ligase A
MRCKRNWALYHGTVLCAGADLSLISSALHQPAREPSYRQGRSHSEFLTCLPVNTETVTHALIKAWRADQILQKWPKTMTAALVRDKYACSSSWNNHG